MPINQLQLPAEARDVIEIARGCLWPELIEDLMADIFTGKMGYGSLSFVFVVCATAVSGARH